MRVIRSADRDHCAVVLPRLSRLHRVPNIPAVTFPSHQPAYWSCCMRGSRSARQASICVHCYTVNPWSNRPVGAFRVGSTYQNEGTVGVCTSCVRSSVSMALSWLTCRACSLGRCGLGAQVAEVGRGEEWFTWAARIVLGGLREVGACTA